MTGTPRKNAYIWYTLETDRLEHRVELDTVFDNRLVRVATQTMESTEYGGHLMCHFLACHQLAAALAITIADSPGYNDNTVTTRALRRFDDKVVIMRQEITQFRYLVLYLDDAVQIRYP